MKLSPHECLEGRHRGMHTYRYAQNPEEERIAEAWAAQCDRGHLNYLLGNGAEPNRNITTEQAQLAATVVQWLGSPIGQCFLRDLGYEREEESE